MSLALLRVPRVPNLPSSLEVHLLRPLSQVSQAGLFWPWDSFRHPTMQFAEPGEQRQDARTSSADPDVLQMFRSPCPSAVLLAHVRRARQPCLVEQNFVGFAESVLGPVSKRRKKHHQSSEELLFSTAQTEGHGDHMTSPASFPGPCWCPPGAGTAAWTAPAPSAWSSGTRGPGSGRTLTSRSSPAAR